MKHLIIAGVPRAGKSTLSRMAAGELGWQHVSMDAIIAGFERCFPEAGIDTGLSVNKDKGSMEILHIISGKIGPFLRAMTDPDEYDCQNGQEVPHAVYQYEPDATEFFSEFRKLKEGFAGGSSLLEILPMYLAFDHRVLDFGNMRA